jgi:hypothetical protein
MIHLKWINQVHLEGWKLGIKTFYYLRTDSVIKGDLGSRMADCVSVVMGNEKI